MKRFIGLLVCTLILVTPVSASASHSYHSNMISKTFVSINDGGEKANHRADKWINGINPTKLCKYRISNHQSVTQPTYDTSDYKYITHVVLIRKHQSLFQRMVIKALRGIESSTK